MRWILIELTRMYQLFVSPMFSLLFGSTYGCRYSVTCSEFAVRTLQEQGAWKGIWPVLKRLLSCHPFAKTALAFAWICVGPTSVAWSKEANDLRGAVAGDGHAWVVDWKLESYQVGIESLLNQGKAVELGFDQTDYLYLKDKSATWKSVGDTKTWNYEDEHVSLTRTITPDPDTGTLKMRAQGKFKASSKLKKPGHLFVSVESVFRSENDDAHDRQLVWYSGQKLERQAIKDGFPARSSGDGLKWVGIQNRYFALALLPDGNHWTGLFQSLADEGRSGGRASISTPVQGDGFDVTFRVYFGPQDLSMLQKADKTLDLLVDFGWFTIIAYPLLKVMKWFYFYIGNYGLAIILLTLLLKVVTYPLTYKSMKSMKDMAKIQPQIQKLKEKHGDDKESFNREMLTLMRSKGYNPMAGCLPILVQMPVFFALYQVLYRSVELYRAPFGLWIHDLSLKDPFFITPVVLTAVMFIQQKMTPATSMDPAQQKMMQFLPVVFGLMMVTLPSGLTIYMLVNTLATIIQQKIMNRKFEALSA